MSKLAYRNLPLASIYVPEERLRKVDEAWAEMLGADMVENGQIQPIVVVEDGERFRLVAGEHRYIGAMRAGLTHIDCKVESSDVSEDELALYEIDENLFRNELSPIERDISLAKRKEIYERLYRAQKHGGDRKSKSNGQNVRLISFSKDAAKKTGLNRRTIDRSVARINALDFDVREALKTSPIGRNASEIERLAKLWRTLDDDQQKKLLGAISRGAKTLLNAQKAVGLAPAPADPTQAALGKIESAWARAPKAAREQFLDAVAPGWRKLKIDVAKGAPANDAGEAA